MMTGCTNDEIDQLRAIVARRLGLVLDHSHLNDLAEVLRQQIRRTGSGDAARYLERLSAAPAQAAEIRELADALTVGETYFFRHPDQYRVFAEIALPQRLAERRRQPVR